MSAEETSDAELLLRWSEGDEEAGRTLVDRHFQTVYRFFRRTGDEAAEDLTQRTFVACFENPDRMRNAASFRAFLMGVARNLLLLDRRSEGRRQQRHQRAAAEPIRTRTSPSKAAVRQEEHELLLRALRTLSLEDQLMLELHYWEQFTMAEIASALEMPSGTVKWRLSKGRHALRDAILAVQAEPGIRESTVTNLDSWARSLRDMLDAEEAPSS